MIAFVDFRLLINCDADRLHSFNRSLVHCICFKVKLQVDCLAYVSRMMMSLFIIQIRRDDLFFFLIHVVIERWLDETLSILPFSVSLLHNIVHDIDP